MWLAYLGENGVLLRISSQRDGEIPLTFIEVCDVSGIIKVGLFRLIILLLAVDHVGMTLIGVSRQDY